MIDPADDRVSVEKLNGKNYSVHIIRKTQLIPLQAGDITLDPVELDNNIYFIRADKNTTTGSDQGMGGLLDRLFEPEISGTPFTEHIVLESKPVTVHVKPLPETGKPADFNGAVGKYSIDASLDSKEVDTGDAAILTVTVKGSGNLPVINAPLISWPAGTESYDVSSKEKIDKTVAPLSGSKIFDYHFISAKPGKYILPPISMSYFDPASRSYKTIETGSLQFQANAARKKKNVKPVAIPAKTIGTEWTKYILWSAAFLMIAFATVFIYRQSKKEAILKAEKEKAMREKMKPIPPVIDPLRESRELMASGDFSRFYASVNRAIWKSVSDKLQLPASDLNKLNIASGLRTQDWTDDEIIRLKTVLNECELKLYTPEYSASDMQRMLDSAAEICSRLKA